jgi:FkbH-like protein
MSTATQQTVSASPRAGSVKCVVWDLDNTLWHGVLLEGDCIVLRHNIPEIIKRLDERGVLHSIASRNDEAAALKQLQDLGLNEFFLCPQIGWNSKAESIRKIAESLNLGLDSIAFIDDQEFERDEVSFSLPQVLCLDVADIPGLLERPELTPAYITDEARLRRRLYKADIERNAAEEKFTGPKEEFLAQLNMVFTIAPAEVEDLRRAEELTRRTHQLNTTGNTYSYEELDGLRQSPHHRLLIGRLDDRYGSYGTIGLALLECGSEEWTIKLLLMSCRVMSRGVGSIMLNHILQSAKKKNVSLLADFKPTSRNRMMYMTYKFAGFKEMGKGGDVVKLSHDLERVPSSPGYLKVVLVD